MTQKRWSYPTCCSSRGVTSRRADASRRSAVGTPRGSKQSLIAHDNLADDMAKRAGEARTTMDFY
jgi:hypothetical protein